MKAIQALIFLSVGAALSFIPNYLSYDRYWNKTIYRVQTVDFNILSHTLPTKLSELMIRGENDEIVDVVNSNYGLFWIVVTDCTVTTRECPKQNILYTSKPYDDISVSVLKGELFNVLRDPAPIYPEWEFSNTRASEPTSLNQGNFGVPIGRVYYVRNSPPDFIGHLTRSLTRITKDPRNLLNPRNLLDTAYVVTLLFFVVIALASWIWHERHLKAINTIARLGSNYRRLIDNKDAEIADYHRRLEELNANQESEREKLRSRIKTAEQEKSKLSHGLEKLEEERRRSDAVYVELLAYLESDKQELKEEKADLERKNNRLEQEKEICENQVSGLDQEVRNLREQLDCSRIQPENQGGYLDMSEYRFAIVSGHPNVAERIIRELRNKHHVSRIEFIENRLAERRNRLAPRLENVDFVLLLINYGPHAATQAARDLCRGHLIELPRIDNGERLREFIEVKVRIKIMRDRLDELV